MGEDQRQASGLALPAHLRRSLRLLHHAQLDWLVKSVSEEARRRDRNLPARSPLPEHRAERPAPAKSARAKSGAANRAAAVTPGQERLILAAFQAGLKTAAITWVFRVSRSTVQHVITPTNVIAARRSDR